MYFYTDISSSGVLKRESIKNTVFFKWNTFAVILWIHVTSLRSCLFKRAQINNDARWFEQLHTLIQASCF